MRIGIAFLCTNAYFILGIRFVKKFVKHYKGTSDIDFYLFTDTDPRPYLPNIPNVHYIHTTHVNWQDGTNSKFKNILTLGHEACDYFYYFDADTDVSKPFTEEWFLGDLVGGEHYNNDDKKADGTPAEKPYDRNPLSRAYVPRNTSLPQTYSYGAFFGGKKENILSFCQKLVEDQCADKLIRYEPSWNDESYINRYFHFSPPTYTVPKRSFAFVISDKGGIGETRPASLDINALKGQVLANPAAVFNFQDGFLRFES